MKKIILTLLALSAMAFTAKAQWYVGGNVGLSATTANSTIGWNITPEGGYILNETMQVGASLNFSGACGGTDEKYSSFKFLITPYYRWAFYTIKSLRFWLEGDLALGSYTATAKAYDGTKFSGTQFAWGIAVAPLISYDITQKWSIFTRIASIGVSGQGSDVSFNFMAINGPSIGVQYRF